MGMPDEFEVEVRQDHISRGLRNSRNCCPVALAIREKFNLSTFGVSISEVARVNGVKYISIKMIQFVSNFDMFIDVYPQTFCLTKIK